MERQERRFGTRRLFSREQSDPGHRRLRDPVDYLVAEGYLAKANFSTLNSESGLNLSESDLTELAADAEIPESILFRLEEDHQRNIRIIAKIEEMARRHNRIIVFATSVRHAHLIASILDLRGTTSFVVTGTTDSIMRDRILVKFKGDDPNSVVIVNYGVLTTGFDAPKTSAALIARRQNPLSSTARWWGEPSAVCEPAETLKQRLSPSQIQGYLVSGMWRTLLPTGRTFGVHPKPKPNNA